MNLRIEDLSRSALLAMRDAMIEQIRREEEAIAHWKEREAIEKEPCLTTLGMKELTDNLAALQRVCAMQYVLTGREGE